MKTGIIFFFALWVNILAGQTLIYSYSLDTFHVGGNLKVDSMFLVETVTGTLVSSGAPDLGTTTGARDQSLSTPIYITDTAQLTTLASRYLQDSINIAAKLGYLKAQMELLGAKARAIQHIRDSVIYGAWLYEIENIWKFPAPDHQDIRTGFVDHGHDDPDLVGYIRQKRTAK